MCLSLSPSLSLSLPLSVSPPETTTILSFERDADRFFEPHSLTQLANGKVMLMDDGNSRPGCSAVNQYKGCWSRALMLDLDFVNATAKASWQYSDPYTLNELKDWGEEVSGRRALF